MPPADIEGKGFTVGYGPAPIVYAGDYASGLTDTPELCGVGSLGDFESPWPAGTFSGEIVVCDRGTFGRVEKGANVLAAGAGGYILANDPGNAASLTGDAHELPGVHISNADGVVHCTVKNLVVVGVVAGPNAVVVEVSRQYNVLVSQHRIATRQDSNDVRAFQLAMDRVNFDSGCQGEVETRYFSSIALSRRMYFRPGTLRILE